MDTNRLQSLLDNLKDCLSEFHAIPMSATELPEVAANLEATIAVLDDHLAEVNDD